MTASNEPKSATERLLEAAEQLLASNGTHGTGLLQIREQAKVSHGSLYHAFPDGKDELVASSITRSGLRILNELTFLIENLPLAEACDALFTATANQLIEADFERGCAVGVPASDGHNVERIGRAAAEAFSAFVDLLDAAARREGIDEEMAQRLALDLVSLQQGAILVSVVRRDVASLRSAGQLARSAIEQALP